MALKQESKLIQSTIKEVLSGKSSAFEQLYNVHAGRIYTLGLKFFEHSKTASEELTRRVFVKAFENIKSYPENITFILWLRKLAVEELLEGGIKRAREIHQVSPVDEALFSLPEKERIVFILSDIDKLEIDELVEVTNMAPEEIKNKLHHSRNTLMEFFKVENLKDLDYKVNFVQQKPEPQPYLWRIIYDQIHSYATKDLKEEKNGEVLNVGDAKLTLGEKIEKLKQEKKRKEVFLKPVNVTISRKALYTFLLLVLIIAAAVYFILREQHDWKVTTLSGTPKINGSFRNFELTGSTNLKSNEYLSTDQNSKAAVEISDIGRIILNPSSSVRRDGSATGLMLSGGLIEIENKRSELFPVEVHSVDIKSYKSGKFTVEIDRNSAEIYSKDASLILESGDKKVYLLPGFKCEVMLKGELGLPYIQTASKDLVNAVNNFSFDGNEERFKIILLLCEKEDALTLFNILPRVDKSSREMVINKLHSLINIPSGTDPRLLNELNETELEKWFDQIEASYYN